MFVKQKSATVKYSPHSTSNNVTRDLIIILMLTIMILMSLKLEYLSTNALLIQKIKDETKPKQIRSDLIKSNIGFGGEKFEHYQLLWWNKFHHSCNSFSVLFDVVCQIPPTLPGVFAMNSSQPTLWSLRGAAFRRNTTTGVLLVIRYGTVLAANTIICPRKSGWTLVYQQPATCWLAFNQGLNMMCGLRDSLLRGLDIMHVEISLQVSLQNFRIFRILREPWYVPL